MAYTKVSLKHYDDNMEIVNRLAKVNHAFVYGTHVSLAIAKASCEEENRLIKLKHDLLAQADELGAQILAAAKKADDDMSNLRTSIRIEFGSDSDEYVFAGGTRQTDIAEKSKATRQNKKMLDNDKK
jgi:hypothetical protein